MAVMSQRKKTRSGANPKQAPLGDGAGASVEGPRGVGRLLTTQEGVLCV